MIEHATQTETTFKRKSQEMIDDFFKKHGLRNLAERGKFLRKIKDEQRTGIFIIQYGKKSIAANQPENSAPDEEPLSFSDYSKGRPTTSAFVFIEHARKILEDLNKGVGITGILRAGGLENTKELYKDLRALSRTNAMSGGRVYVQAKELLDKGVSGKRYTVAVMSDGGYRVYADTDGSEVVSFDLKRATPTIQVLAACVSVGRRKRSVLSGPVRSRIQSSFLVFIVEIFSPYNFFTEWVL